VNPRAMPLAGVESDQPRAVAQTDQPRLAQTTAVTWKGIGLIGAGPNEHPAALAVVLCRLAALNDLDDLDDRPRLHFPPRRRSLLR